MKFQDIYYIGHKCQKYKNNDQLQLISGFDDDKGEYIYQLSDHIAFRYEILNPAGKGSFGSVVKVFDHKKKEICALKIIKNKKKFHEQSKIEIGLLKYIQEQDVEQCSNVVKVKNDFIFRGHTCIVTEILSINLFELMKNNQFNALSLELIRRISIQILNSIHFLHKHNIIHCDLKPENILLKQENKSGIRIIDFGSSCFQDQQLYTYIQSRFYRAPEVMLGCGYSRQIDIWSFGCIVAELYMGYPIFPGEKEEESIGYMCELLGIPPKNMLEESTRKQYFFNKNGTAKPVQNRQGEHLIPDSKSFYEIVECPDQQFLDFIKQCLKWDPQVRFTPKQALLHPWIIEGLPSEIKNQHIQMWSQEEDDYSIMSSQCKEFDNFDISQEFKDSIQKVNSSQKNLKIQNQKRSQQKSLNNIRNQNTINININNNGNQI